MTLQTPIAPGLANTTSTPASSMPGWSIVVDLTPPELIAARRLKTVRIVVVTAVVIVMAACVGVYYMARSHAATAADNLAAEQAITASLQNEQKSYGDVIALKRSIESAHARVATLMASDVDVAALIGSVTDALPAGMTITSLDITIPETIGADQPGAKTGGSAVLDTSDATHIGAISLSGTGDSLDDVPAYIDALTSIDGIYDAYPTANHTGAEGTDFTVEITLTDALLSGLFAPDGGS